MLGIYGAVPSAFQGRIGGAKGMWMIDALREPWEGSKRKFWIEITDSQLKFQGHPIDEYDPDPARLTFEVKAVPTSLSAATLNYQLMPILINRGVPSKVFEKLLENDLIAKVSELEAAMNSGLALRKWTQDKSSVMAERGSTGTSRWMGGMPESLAEKITWFVEVCCTLTPDMQTSDWPSSTVSSQSPVASLKNSVSQLSVLTAIVLRIE